MGFVATQEMAGLMHAVTADSKDHIDDRRYVELPTIKEGRS